MANEIKIAAELREEFGKGAARRIRRENKVPVVLYGHGTEPQHLTVPGHETLLALRTANALLSLEVAGGESRLVLPKQVQRDPITGFLKHIDFIIVKRGEKVTVDVPLVVTGAPAEDGLVVNQDTQALSLEVEATNIPESIEISVEGLNLGDRITVADITLPEGASFLGENPEETVLVAIAAPKAEEPEESEDAEGEDADGESAEGDAAEGDAECAES